jgi:hypothetical protein
MLRASGTAYIFFPPFMSDSPERDGSHDQRRIEPWLPGTKRQTPRRQAQDERVTTEDKRERAPRLKLHSSSKTRTTRESPLPRTAPSGAGLAATGRWTRNQAEREFDRAAALHSAMARPGDAARDRG